MPTFRHTCKRSDGLSCSLGTVRLSSPSGTGSGRLTLDGRSADGERNVDVAACRP
jgi:hypothetical protein